MTRKDWAFVAIMVTASQVVTWGIVGLSYWVAQLVVG